MTKASYVEDPWPLTSDEWLLPEPISYDPETEHEDDDEEEEEEDKGALRRLYSIHSK